MPLTDLFGDDDSAAAAPAGRRSAGWFKSVQVVPVAVVAAIAMAIPPLAYYGRIPVTLALGDGGPLVAWLAVAAAWVVGLLGAGAGLIAAATARRFGWVAVIALVSLVLGGVALAQQSDQAVSAMAYYDLHEGAFGQVKSVAVAHRAEVDAARASQDSADAAEEIDLPPAIQEHSVSGRLLVLGEGLYLLPVSTGLGDGFLYTPDGPPQEHIGDLTELGGGWYWLTGAPGP
jgi:hypothetical protein